MIGFLCIYIYIYTIVRYMGGFLTPRVAEYGMYGHGCMGVGCIPTYMDVRAWAVFKGSGMYLYRYLIRCFCLGGIGTVSTLS